MIAPIGTFIDGTVIQLPMADSKVRYKYAIIMSCIGEHTDVVTLNQDFRDGDSYVQLADHKLSNLPHGIFYANCNTIYRVSNQKSVDKVGVLTRTDLLNCRRVYDLLVVNNRYNLIILN